MQRSAIVLPGLLDGFAPLPGSPAAPARVRGEDLWFVVLRGGVAQ